MNYDDDSDELEDYHAEPGCCLTCSDAEPGCLCYQCKCRQCCWYSKSEGDENGHCSRPKYMANLPSDYYVENIQRETEKAVLGDVKDFGCIWIPKSALDSDNRIKRWFIDKLREKA